MKRHLKWLAVSSICAWLGISSSAEPFGWSTQRLQDWSLHDSLIFAEGKFWLRKPRGLLGSSSDGLSWEWRDTTAALGAGFVYGNSIFLMPITWGTAVSADASDWLYHWTIVPGQSTRRELMIAHGNGWFVVASAHDVMPALAGLHRTDTGREWTKTHQFETPEETFFGLSFANGRFLASARAGTPATNHVILVSEEGEAWTTLAVPAPAQDRVFESIASDGTVYVGAGAGLTTFQLAEEISIVSEALAPLHFGDVAFGNGRFVAVGDGIASSANGADWQLESLPNIGPLHELAFGNGRFLAVGQNTFAVSTNGLDWQVEGRAISKIAGLLAVDDRFVGVGAKTFETGSAILVSTNRGDWKVRDVLPGTNLVTAFAHAEGQYVAAAGTKAYLSSNALDWVEVETGLDGTLAQLAFFQGRFWGAGSNAAGDGVIVEAVPDAPWRVAVTLPKRPLAIIAASADRIVAAGGTNVSRGYVAGSSDGLQWSVSEEFRFQPYTVAHMDGRFIIGGHFSGRALSTDGVNWVHGWDGHDMLRALVKAGDRYVFFHAINSESTRIMTSTNGLDWDRRFRGSDSFRTYLVEHAAVNGRRLVTAQGNTIYEASPLQPALRGISRSKSKLRLEIERWTLEPFAIEASSDLQSWSTVPGLGGNAVEFKPARDWQFFRIK